MEPIADPVPRDELCAEIASLPASATLLELRGSRLLAFRAQQAPLLMRQIGRERERTYRLVGEGTGHALDLDVFDESYLQLVSWDDEDKALVGGYRLGRVPGPLASSETFLYDERLTSQLTHAFELGRSFVVPEHQRSWQALPGLWRGIGALVDQSAEVRLLVGTVSVSSEYSLAARRLIAGFLLAGHRRSPWSRLVAARHPLSPSAVVPLDYRELEERVVALDGRKPPVLVKHYLQLGMRGLGCGLDPAFGGCTDILCVADLRDAPIAMLERFMGTEGAHRFVLRHAGSRASGKAA